MIALPLALFAVAAFAAGPAETKDPAFEVSVDPGVYSPEAFRALGFRTEERSPEPINTFAPPAGEVRDELFAQVDGLEKEIAGMDALDRDLLYIRARNYAPEKLRKLYPQISAERLTALRLRFRR